MVENEQQLEKVNAIAGKTGFYWTSAEIYPDRNAGFFDYGPKGIIIKENFLKLWKQYLFKESTIQIDGSIVLPRKAVEASGHLDNFTDPVISCTKCKAKYRADKLIEEITKKQIPEALSNEEYDQLIKKNKINCPKCKATLNNVERQNIMIKALIGAENKESFLRPETCQSIFLSFSRIWKTLRVKLPFEIAQTGKAFRNEISPRQGLLRAREFDQAELEVFFNPEKENNNKDFPIKNISLNLFYKNNLQKIKSKEALKNKIISSQLIAHYLELVQNFYVSLGFDLKKLRFRYVPKEDRAFYSKETWDLEIETSLGWVELGCLNHRQDHDLLGHQKQSQMKLEVMDESVNKKVLPNVFEVSLGIGRPIFCLLDTTYQEEPKNDRTLFKLNLSMAPVQVAVFPLISKDKLPEKAKEIFSNLKNFRVFYDESGSIGKRYRRQDEIGTPYCITIDHQTLKDKTVTVRERDSMKQTRIKIDKLIEELK